MARAPARAPRVRGVEQQATVAVDPGSEDEAGLEEVAAERRRRARANVDPSRAIVHQGADLVEVAGRREPAPGHDEDVRPEPFHLVEHVARHDDAPALRSEPVEELDHVRPLPGIEPRERLVQHDHPGLVDDRLRELHALAHPFRERGQAPLVIRVELDRGERGPGGDIGIRQAVQRRRQAHEPERGQWLEHGLLLRHEPELAGHADVPARVAAEEAHRSARGPREPAQHPQHGRLARAVRAEQRGDPRTQFEADVGDGDEAAEPLRHPADLDHGAVVNGLIVARSGAGS